MLWEVGCERGEKGPPHFMVQQWRWSHDTGPTGRKGHYAGWKHHAHVTPNPAFIGAGAYVWGVLLLSRRRGQPRVHTTVSTWHISNMDDSLPDASS